MNELIEMIPEGRDNPIKRSELVKVSNLTDRAVRNMISQYNKSGEGLVLNMGDGYFRVTENDRPIVERAIRREISRSREIETTVRSMKRFLNNCKGQEVM